MATKKPPPQGTFKDPFQKWEDGSTRVVSQLLKNAVEEKARLTQAETRVQALKSSINSLSGPEAAVAKRLLVEALRELKEAQKAQRDSTIDRNNLSSLQVDTASKLAAIRTWMSNQTLNPADERRAKIVKQLLEKVLIDVSASNIKDVDFRRIENSLKVIEEHTATLPEDLSARFAAQEQAMLDIQKKQEEARQFLAEHKKMLNAFGARILSGLANMSMRLADRIGVGPFTLGNVLRGAGALGRGAMAVGRFGQRVARGETYVQRYIRAKREAEGSDDSQGLTGRLIDLVKKTGANNMWFQRRLLREVEKQGRDKKEGSGSVLGKLGLLLSSLMGSISKFFGQGGLIKSIASIGRWLAPLAGAARFVLTRAMPVIGAFLGGWKIGGLIYEKYATQIQDSIDNVIGALKGAYDWVANKIGGAKDWATGAYQKSKNAVVGGAQSLYSKAIDTAASVGQSVVGAAQSISQSGPVQAATGLVSGAYRAGESAGSFIKEGVGKLSSLVGSVLTKSPAVDVDNLSPMMQSSVGQMAQDYFVATGRKLQINSGYRSNEEQARLFKSMPLGMAARPGSSLHNYGLAVDIPTQQANELQKLGLLDKYGLTRPIASEKWHVQPKGVSIQAARSGIYSADAPKNQGAATPVPQTTGSGAPANMGQPSVGSRAPSMSQGAAINMKTVAGSKPVGLNDIPTHDTSDSLLFALNIGVIG
jgi:hypothetical protein